MAQWVKALQMNLKVPGSVWPGLGTQSGYKASGDLQVETSYLPKLEYA